MKDFVNKWKKIKIQAKKPVIGDEAKQTQIVSKI